mgnify:CR=1 FL=1
MNQKSPGFRRGECQKSVETLRFLTTKKACIADLCFRKRIRFVYDLFPQTEQDNHGDDCAYQSRNAQSRKDGRQDRDGQSVRKQSEHTQQEKQDHVDVFQVTDGVRVLRVTVLRNLCENSEESEEIDRRKDIRNDLDDCYRKIQTEQIKRPQSCRYDQKQERQKFQILLLI